MNKGRFWTGIGLFGFEALLILGFFLNSLNWSWLTEKVLELILVGLMLVAYNTLAAILLWNGSEKDAEE